MTFVRKTAKIAFPSFSSDYLMTYDVLGSQF